jgi:type IV pilus assembly protein PilA
MAEAVFLGRDGQQLGPYTRSKLAEMAARGEIREGDFAWHEGLEDWLPAAAVLERLGIRRGALPETAPPQTPGDSGDTAAGRRAPIVPGWMMGELDQAALYEVFLGRTAARYLPIFQRFDAGEGSTSWNLPAGLVTQLWMIYRGMYRWGLLWYPALGLLAGFLVGTICIAVGGASGGSLSSLLFVPASIAVMGLYGDRIYHGHARALIEESGRIGLDPVQRNAWLARKGGTHLLSALLVLALELGLFGVLAVVAVPAYQDYLIRSQVAEGMVIAAEAQRAVENFYAGQHYFPPDNAGARLPAPGQLGGNYVQGVEVQDGTVTVTFGSAAEPHIAGAVLVFVPQDAAGRLAWRCGGDGSTLAPRYRPPACR